MTTTYQETYRKLTARANAAYAACRHATTLADYRAERAIYLQAIAEIDALPNFGGDPLKALRQVNQ
ncbi:MAG: hypothetical protein GY938_13275 [Ketobacter sp.]|nr:hypothetical protein [Ketobacter sp.]